MEKMREAFEKVKSHQTVEKMKMLVGMEVINDEESSAVNDVDDQSSFAFMDDFNRNCTLSTQQRIQGFVVCFVVGLTCTFLSMLVFLNPIKFGILFTLGNLLAIGSTAFLIGPKRQVTMMLDPVRIYATALYIASMIIALFCALYVHNKLLTLFGILLEFGALTWVGEYELGDGGVGLRRAAAQCTARVLAAYGQGRGVGGARSRFK